MEKKIGALTRIFSRDKDKVPRLRKSLKTLSERFSDYSFSIEQLFQKDIPLNAEQKFSFDRGNFKSELKSLTRKADKEVRQLSLSVQSEMSSTVSAVAALFAVFLLFSAGMVLWVGRAFHPLIQLQNLVKEISARGLRDSDRETLQSIGVGGDEISTFAHEFGKMASSVIDRNNEIDAQKSNLEKAHVEMAKQNELLRKTKTKLMHQEKLGFVGKLAAQMAHEIRNPLNAIGLHLESLEFDVDNPSSDFMDTVSCMKQEIDRLSVVSRSYLDLAKKPKLDFSSIDIHKLIRETLNLYKPILVESKVSVDQKMSDVPQVWADEKSFKASVWESN